MDWIDQAPKHREVRGKKKYGSISPKNDPRCFRKEIVEEPIDALNYAQWVDEKGKYPPFNPPSLRETSRG